MKGKKKIIIASVVIILFALLIIVKLLLSRNRLDNAKELKHYHNVDTMYITDISKDEQEIILEAYNVVIPQSENTAYITRFSKCDYNDGYYSYSIEFNNVLSYDAFYEANTHRIGENGLKGQSLNQLFNDESEYYLTYSEIIGPHHDQTIAELFDELYSKRIA